MNRFRRINETRAAVTIVTRRSDAFVCRSACCAIDKKTTRVRAATRRSPLKCFNRYVVFPCAEHTR